MKISATGLRFIGKWEGFVDHAYADVVGISTIGYGHVIRKNEQFPGKITIEQGLQLLQRDVAVAETAVNEQVKISLNQGQFDALVSFVFNLGSGALASSTLLKLLNAKDISGAADEFVRWIKAGGKPNQGLLNRRNAERELFLSKPAVSTNDDSVIKTEDESNGDRFIKIAKSYVGCSLNTRRGELADLVSRGVDKPEEVVMIATNCATTALGIMALAGVNHPLLKKPYIIGIAIIWLRQIGVDLGALIKYRGESGPQPKPGSLLRYVSSGTNNDHVEWLTSTIDSNGIADHVGGGRPNNAITQKRDNVFSNNGRPLVEFWDPDKLLLSKRVEVEIVNVDTKIVTEMVTETPTVVPNIESPQPIEVTPVPQPIIPVNGSTGIFGFIIQLIQTILSIFTRGK